jgi:hypothetical protein
MLRKGIECDTRIESGEEKLAKNGLKWNLLQQQFWKDFDPEFVKKEELFMYFQSERLATLTGLMK